MKTGGNGGSDCQEGEGDEEPSASSVSTRTNDNAGELEEQEGEEEENENNDEDEAPVEDLLADGGEVRDSLSVPTASPKTGPSMDAALESFRRDWRNELEQRNRRRQTPQLTSLQRQLQQHCHIGDIRARPPPTLQTPTPAGQDDNSREEEEEEDEYEDGEDDEEAEEVRMELINVEDAEPEDEEKVENDEEDASPFPKERQQSGLHVSDLPHECLLHVVRWLIGWQLDYGSLCQLGCVCTGFSELANEPLIWSLIGRRIWGLDGVGRDFVLTRPYPRFDGVYVAKCSYVRRGEPDIGRFYPPCHLIEYYRYLRFLPPDRPTSGKAMLLTANEPPEVVTACMQQWPGVLLGEYKFSGACGGPDRQPCAVRCAFVSRPDSATAKRRHARQSQLGLRERRLEYYCDFSVQQSRRRRLSTAYWTRYQLVASTSTGDTCTTDFDTADVKSFPPLRFLRLRGECGERPL